jgi:hypothetical protein
MPGQPVRASWGVSLDGARQWAGGGAAALMHIGDIAGPGREGASSVYPRPPGAANLVA